MPIVKHKKDEVYPYELKLIVLERMAKQHVPNLARVALGQFYWPSDGWHDDKTGEIVTRPS